MNNLEPTEEEKKKFDERLELEVETGDEERAPNEFDEDEGCSTQGEV